MPTSASYASVPVLSALENSERSAQITRAPSEASASADDLPMPEAAPSTIAVFLQDRKACDNPSRRTSLVAGTAASHPDQPNREKRDFAAEPAILSLPKSIHILIY
jgi:hypothetical protein